METITPRRFGRDLSGMDGRFPFQTSPLGHRYWRSLKANAAASGDYHVELVVKNVLGSIVTVTSGMLSSSSDLQIVAPGLAGLLDGTDVPTNGSFATDYAGIGAYLLIDFGAGNGQNLHTWIYTMAGATTPAVWNIQWSDDNSAWTTVYTGLDCSGGAGDRTATW